ncbi:DUF6078 family protein [Porphyromonas loveana]|uniref:DUF6078 family protein n=1 Tax=Porphyromonas loveana TaxID=1884669 RepID=UPI0035A1ADD8
MNTATTIPSGYDRLPTDYQVCATRPDCPVRGQCLRASAYDTVARKGASFLTIVNPLIPCTAIGCEFFATNMPMMYALGISQLLDDLPYRAAVSIKKESIAYFGRTNFFRIRTKARYITIEEQAYIRSLFQDKGIDPDRIRYDEMHAIYDTESPIVRTINT